MSLTKQNEFYRIGLLLLIKRLEIREIRDYRSIAFESMAVKLLQKKMARDYGEQTLQYNQQIKLNAAIRVFNNFPSTQSCTDINYLSMVSASQSLDQETLFVCIYNAANTSWLCYWDPHLKLVISIIIIKGTLFQHLYQLLGLGFIGICKT